MKKESLKENQTENNENFERAVAFAVDKHSTQKRKGTHWPYIVHIYEVAQILQENNADLDTLIAGILHDTVEDTNTTLQEIADNFGYKVASYVDVLSENKALPYKERKALQAERIKLAPREAKMIKCADCLSNLRSICFDEKISADVWSKFNSTKENIQEHYSATIEAISDLGNLEMFDKLKGCYQLVFGDKKSSESIQENLQVENMQESAQKIQSKTILKTTKVTPFVFAGKKISDCTECSFMERRRTPDPDDWFNDDDEEYSCHILGRVLSEMNRPYEKQPIPVDCPIRERSK